jgi:DNA-binding beta-propeller fold protein YncE
MFRPQQFVTLAGVALFLLLSGCAQIPAVFEYRPADEAKQELVWPGPPEQARYRYVGQLTGEENFPRPGEKTVNAGVRFMRWLVGLVGHGKAPVILQRPEAVISDGQGRVYVSDVSRQAIYLFDTQEAKLSVWEQAGKNLRFEVPIGMALGVDGELLVADASLHMIVRLGRDGHPLGYFGRDDLLHPVGLTRDAQRGRIYVADRGSNSVKVFSDAGKKLFEFGKFGEAEGMFNGLTYLFRHDDKLYVTDTLNSRIQIFSPEGEYLSSFGRRGLYIGDLPRPKGVAVGPEGKIYVVESYYDYLLIFDDKGELLLPIGGSGHEIGQFYLPAGVWVDNSYVYVADTFNGRVMIFEYLGDGDASEVAGDSSSDTNNAAGN